MYGGVGHVLLSINQRITFQFKSDDGDIFNQQIFAQEELVSCLSLIRIFAWYLRMMRPGPKYHLLY